MSTLVQPGRSHRPSENGHAPYVYNHGSLRSGLSRLNSPIKHQASSNQVSPTKEAGDRATRQSTKHSTTTALNQFSCCSISLLVLLPRERDPAQAEPEMRKQCFIHGNNDDRSSLQESPVDRHRYSSSSSVVVPSPPRDARDSPPPSPRDQKCKPPFISPFTFSPVLFLPSLWAASVAWR
jgi:hypothetical protein